MPLGDPLARSVAAPHEAHPRIRLLLHGDFFVDAGRRGPDLPSWGEDVPVTPTREDELRKLWNQTLVRDAVLPNVLPALADFCDGLDDGTACELTRALSDAFDHHHELARWHEALWNGHQWVFRLGKRGALEVGHELGTWQLVPADRAIYLLPEPPTDRHDLPWDVFPSLVEVCTHLEVTYAEWPRISPKREAPAAWPASALVKLFAGVEPATFEDVERLRYLTGVVASIDRIKEEALDPAIADALVAMLRRAVQAVSLIDLERQRDSLAAVLRAIGAAHLLFVELGVDPGLELAGADVCADRLERLVRRTQEPAVSFIELAGLRNPAAEIAVRERQDTVRQVAPGRH